LLCLTEYKSYIMKKIFTLCTLLIASLTAMSQAPTKFDFYLAQKQAALAQDRIDGSQVIEVLVQGNIVGIQDLVQKCGGTFKYSYGNIAAIRIPLKSLSSFYISNSVKRMEGAPPHIKACNDTMRAHAHIVEAQMGMSPLTQEYKGKGVIVGMIDSGIDFTHPDFLDSLGKSRILSIWDMNKSVNSFTPSPYGYGQEWDKATLDTALVHNNATTITYMDSSSGLEYGHGTHVSGVATGNGRSNGTCIGAAPEADIMMVTFNFSVQTATEMTDATSFIYNKASAIGEPCVINASLGDYDGSHDGKDLQALMIDSMITAKPGRVFVAAAGNESSVPYHVQHIETPGDTSFTWFQYYSYNGQIIFDAWADTANFRQVQFAIGVDRVAPYSTITHTPFATVLTNLGKFITDTLKNTNGNPIGVVNSYTELMGGQYSLQVQILPDSTQFGKIGNDSSYYWSLITTGTGKIDCWYPDPTPMVNSGLPTAIEFPEIKNYKMPDTISTLCSSFQCSPNVITVGDFFNRKTFIDYDTAMVALYGPTINEGELTSYSGVGPTRDDRIKPDITSPGDFCMSVLATPLRSLYITYAPNKIDTGAWHTFDGGTSTASPGTAGAAALYLEMHPTATNIEVKNAIIYCADQDAYTGATPNNSYGYGKVDAFKMLTGCAGLSIPSIQAPAVTLNAYPNPMKDGAVIDYDFSSVKEFCYASITIYDVNGKQVKNIELKNPHGSVSVSAAGMAAGTYFYSLVVDNKRLQTDKILVIK